jgi:simple sugar transport system substrate-binding protein
MTANPSVIKLCLRAAGTALGGSGSRARALPAALATVVLALAASSGAAIAGDGNLSIYFVGCAAPTGFHGYLARGAAEARKNLGVKVT